MDKPTMFKPYQAAADMGRHNRALSGRCAGVQCRIYRRHCAVDCADGDFHFQSAVIARFSGANPHRVFAVTCLLLPAGHALALLAADNWDFFADFVRLLFRDKDPFT
jgi:hypothetical protein